LALFTSNGFLMRTGANCLHFLFPTSVTLEKKPHKPTQGRFGCSSVPVPGLFGIRNVGRLTLSADRFSASSHDRGTLSASLPIPRHVGGIFIPHTCGYTLVFQVKVSVQARWLTALSSSLCSHQRLSRPFGNAVVIYSSRAQIGSFSLARKRL